jgi:hypothetical protein
MRPIVFNLADNAMVEGLSVFFQRENWHHALGCREFDIDPCSDRDFLKVPGRNDDALWHSAHLYLDPFRETHERAVVILDEEFGSSPGAATIRTDVEANLLRSGWEEDRIAVIVIEPMLEAWLWMDSDHVARAFGHPDYQELRARLVEEGLWEAGQPKPYELKAARDRAAKLGRTKSGRAAFANVFASVSSRALGRCTEPGFLRLRETLQRWFPKAETWQP